MLNFKKGRYYLANGFKAEITNIMALYLQGRVLIPHNIWVPTYWYKDGSSDDHAFNLAEYVEGKEEKLQIWLNK